MKLWEELLIAVTSKRYTTLSDIACGILGMRRARGFDVTLSDLDFLMGQLRRLLKDIRKRPEKYGFNIPHVSSYNPVYWVEFYSPELEERFKLSDERRDSSDRGDITRYKTFDTQMENKLRELIMREVYETDDTRKELNKEREVAVQNFLNQLRYLFIGRG